ncbi:hypothetical protein ACN38_g8793 [Penicillium nordicum]|uniref:Uncharacterized protein n=1 Tax=Penicillium nordicum TaxID=229535 RepID=A0A0M8NWM8_9EURO|nr:hypothetical protein ACN38_g8793 [Penicillium nordicum]
MKHDLKGTFYVGQEFTLGCGNPTPAGAGLLGKNRVLESYLRLPFLCPSCLGQCKPFVHIPSLPRTDMFEDL